MYCVLRCKFIQKYTMTASIVYEGNLRCKVTHQQSGTVIEADAPTDNRGKGERFSPTDMLCVALATCIVTTMALKATDLNIDLKETTAELTKHMLSNPRRIGKIDVLLKFPSGHSIDESTRLLLENAGNNCPVAKSIHTDIETNIEYKW